MALSNADDAGATRVPVEESPPAPAAPVHQDGFATKPPEDHERESVPFVPGTVDTVFPPSPPVRGAGYEEPIAPGTVDFSSPLPRDLAAETGRPQAFQTQPAFSGGVPNITIPGYKLLGELG